jgi:hypothetical protein
MKILIALILFISTGAHAKDDNLFTSPTLGFHITKPTAWRFVSANTYLDQMKEMRFADAEFQRQWSQAIRAPVVVIAKHPPDFNEVNTTFKVDVKPYGVIPEKSTGVTAFQVLVPNLKRVTKDFNVEEGPREAVVGGRNGAYLRASYFVTSSTGVQVALTSEMWVIPLSNYIYIIGGSYKKGSDSGPSEVAAIMKTIAID